MDFISSIGKAIIGALSAPILFIQSFFTPAIEPPVQPVGGDQVTPIAGSTYYLAGSGISSSATSVTLTSFTIPQSSYPIQDSDMPATFYMTLEPGNRTRQEIVSCTTVGSNTGSNVTISGCTRGLSPITPYTASSTLQFAHAGGTQVIFSNPPHLYNQAAFKDNDETVTGIWQFNTNLPTSSLTATTSAQFVTKSLLDATANQGAATSTESNGGIVELGTLAEQASSFDGGVSKPTVIQTKNSTSTCQVVGSYNVVASTTTGKIDKGCIDQTANYAFTGTNSFSQPLTLNSIAYTFPASQTANTYLKTDGSGTLSWAGIGNTLATTTAQLFSTTQTSTTTIVAITIPANTMSTANALQCHFIGDRNGNGTVYTQSGGVVTIEASYGGTATTTAVFTQSSGSGKGSSDVYINMTAAGATNSQRLSITSAYFNTGPGLFTGSSSTDSTTAQPFYVRVLSSASSYFAPDQVICSYVK